MMTIDSIVGARPQFIKLAPISRAFANRGDMVRHRIVHTGQHYDQGMSDVFFEELEIPKPDIELHIGSAPHGQQTGAMLAALELEFEAHRPDVILVYGDTNSTLAATLAATKMHIPVCHVEAGLRSFNREMPEEINRLVADHCADRLYAPTPVAMRHLDREGLAERSVLSGDVMLDAVRYNVGLAEKSSDVMARFGLTDREFGIATIHRPINTARDALVDIVEAFGRIAGNLPLVFPMHPRTRAVLDGALNIDPGLHIVEPLGYLDMLRALGAARLVLTDSGGLQKEAAFLGTPCVTLREETEWTETVEIGANVLVGQSTDRLEEAVQKALGRPPASWEPDIAEHNGDGKAAQKIDNDNIDRRQTTI